MNRYVSSQVVILALASICVSEARAITVANGCAIPTPTLAQRAFYADPIKGSMSNDGSAARPWGTLADIFDSRKKTPGTQAGSINPGDIIYLNSGDHGNVLLAGAVNKEFITVQAAPGQTPTLRSLRVAGASKWMFVGLKVQGAGDGSGNSWPGPALIEFGRNLSFGPTNDIIFAGNSVSTTDDSSGWTDLDWVKKPFVFGLLSSATCVTISGNHFYNLRNALQFDGERHLIDNNKIDNFGSDAIDMIASNTTIRNNSITDGHYTKSEPSHPDGIQGWTKQGATNRNVVIDGNIIIKIGDPKITEMQGIGIFDGKWDGLTISNNVVVTNHWHGISVGGVQNAKIINNTVVAYDPVNRPTWISVNRAKDGTPPKNVIVRNNITTRLVYPDEGVIADHNLVSQRIDTTVFGKPTYNSRPGSYGDHNMILPDIYESFVSVDHTRGTYDLRLKVNSPAMGSGNPEQAPPRDIMGKARKVPIDIGAYSR